MPPNFYWQRYIEVRFPGFPNLRNVFKSNTEKDKPVLDLEDSLPRKEKPPRRQTFSSGPSSSPSGSGWRNFAMKFTLDQTVAGVVNIVLFIVLINLLKGEVGIGGLWKLVCDVCFPCLACFLILDLTMIGLAPYYDRPPQVSASGLGIDVYCHSGRPASGVRERVWCHLGSVFKSVRGCLAVCYLVFCLSRGFHSYVRHRFPIRSLIWSKLIPREVYQLLCH